MSTIQNDQEIEQNRRDVWSKEGIEAPLVDQIPKKLLAKLRDMEVGEMCSKLWNQGNADRSEWLEKQEKFFNDWDNFVEPATDGPFDQSSNLHLPMGFIVVKTYHARMLQALLGSEPMVLPRRADALDKAPTVSAIMKYAMKDWANHRMGVEEVKDTYVWDWCAKGCGILKWGWDCTYTRFLDVEDVEEEGPPEFVTGPNGEELVRPTTRIVQKEVDRKLKVFEGPILSRLQVEDLLIIGGEGDPQLADAVQHRQYLTKSQLYTLAYRGIFEEDGVDEVIKSGPDTDASDQVSGIKQRQQETAGQRIVDTEADLDRYEILECYLKLDVDNSGIDSDIICWVHPQTSTILRATYLYRVSKSGMRPFFKADFHKRPGQQYGMGLIEVLYPLTQELDVMHNMRIDYGLMSTMPIGFYRASSSLKPEKIQMEPGVLIPLDNPQQDVYFPNLGNRTSFGFQEEASLMGFIEKLTGLSDLSYGSMSGSQGATRTATGARALVNEANNNLDVHLRRLFQNERRLQEYLLHMLQQRIEPGFAFKITGEQEGSVWFVTINSREDINGDFDFEIDPSSAQSNPQVQAERAGLVLQTASNPLFLQLGIVNQTNLYEAVKNYLKSNGIKNFSRFITKPQGAPAVQLSPEEILNRVIRGIPTSVSPTDDNEGFLSYMQQFMANDEQFGLLTESQARALAGHAQERQQLLEAMQQQEAQAANVQQQRTNAATAQNQAPTAMSPLAGSQG